jgi:acyl-CoA thioester hydrolase
MEHYPLKLRLRIDWSEIDLFGHVNNVAFLKYIQASRVNYWEQIGLYQLYAEKKLGPMLLSTACQYKKPLFYPGNITVEVTLDYIKNTSFGFRHRVIDDAGAVAAEATDVMVMYDFNTHQKMPFPEACRAAAEKLENKKF